ncbi:MAG: septum formation initiator family protein [Thermodesulfobacteriota bacterium]
MPATITQQLNHQEKKRIFIFSSVILALLLAWLIFSPVGSLKFLAVNKELSTIETENSTLRTENDTLRQEIARLKTDSDYLEEVARERGLLKRDEMVFVFN